MKCVSAFYQLFATCLLNLKHKMAGWRKYKWYRITSGVCYAWWLFITRYPSCSLQQIKGYAL